MFVCSVFRREVKKESKGAEALLDLYYFDVPPSQLVYTHLPDVEQYQLLETPVSAAEFEKFPQLGRCFFSRFGLRILTHFKSPIKIVRISNLFTVLFVQYTTVLYKQLSNIGIFSIEYNTTYAGVPRLLLFPM